MNIIMKNTSHIYISVLKNKELQLNDDVHFRGHFSPISYIVLCFKILCCLKLFKVCNLFWNKIQKKKIMINLLIRILIRQMLMYIILYNSAFQKSAVQYVTLLSNLINQCLKSQMYRCVL